MGSASRHVGTNWSVDARISGCWSCNGCLGPTAGAPSSPTLRCAGPHNPGETRLRVPFTLEISSTAPIYRSKKLSQSLPLDIPSTGWLALITFHTASPSTLSQRLFPANMVQEQERLTHLHVKHPVRVLGCSRLTLLCWPGVAILLHGCRVRFSGLGQVSQWRRHACSRMTSRAYTYICDQGPFLTGVALEETDSEQLGGGRSRSRAFQGPDILIVTEASISIGVRSE